VLDATWFMPGDARDAQAMHAAKRIPGARFFGIDEIADHHSALPHMLPAPPAFEEAMRELGVRDGQTIVVYDAAGLFSAARVWWSLRAMGADDVYVLDGGLPAWVKAGLPLESGAHAPVERGHFTARFRPELVSDVSRVRDVVAHGGATILDARPGPRFRGEAAEPRAGLKSGHMPGATSAPWNGFVTEDGRLKSVQELRAMFDGLDLDQPLITSCGSGVTAAIVALALARLGRWDASVYDGSWAEWGALSDTPVVTGP
jgi:thiosulfate/3-mercaptopyruvate sulfurtransferase